MMAIPSPSELSCAVGQANEDKRVEKLLEYMTQECFKAINAKYVNVDYSYVQVLISMYKCKKELGYYDSEIKQALKMLISNLCDKSWFVSCNYVGSNTNCYYLEIRNSSQNSWNNRILASFGR